MASGEAAAIGIASILVIGVGAQWIANRLRVPSILLLLLAGFAAGVSGFLNPDALLGDLLLPIVSISVGIILFEGSLGLELREISGHGTVLRRLISWGALITAVLVTLAANKIAGLPLGLSLLLGALLTVTGPTVVGPLLRQMRLTGPAGSILKWEGILIDPIGAIGAVLVFDFLVAKTPGEQTTVVLLGLAGAVVTGLVAGLLIAAVLIGLLRYRLVPDALQNPVTLAVVVGGFVLSDVISSESGLLAVTIAGIVMANQHVVRVKHMLEFKENLRVLLIGGLFVVLASRVGLDQLRSLGIGDYLFVAALILVIRPASVFASTLGSGLKWRSRVFLASMAPRGIVAAAIASLFSLRLAESGVAGADKLLPLTFLVIIGTILVYALGAPVLARGLGISSPDAHGVLVVGAHSWARDVASALKKAGVRVLMADNNPSNAVQARHRDIPTFEGNVLTEKAPEEMNLDGIGILVALTGNDEVNALATLHFAEDFGRDHVYLVAPHSTAEGSLALAEDLRGRVLFGEHATYGALSERFARGERIASRVLGEDPVAEVEALSEAGALNLLTVNGGKRLAFFTSGQSPTPRSGDTLLYLAPPELAQTEPNLTPS